LESQVIAKLAINTPLGAESVQVDFGHPADAVSACRWRMPRGTTTPAMRDSLEFSRLAGKRWRYYAKRSETATSLQDLQVRIKSVPAAEVGFLVVVRSTWKEAPKLLGVCWCRRTWCNHIVLDFAAVHPKALVPQSGYKGIGSTMLQGLALVASAIQSALVWGEATELSAPFYEKVLGIRKVKDHFFIRPSILQKLQDDAARVSQTESAHGEKIKA
jgi:hypothetical protein